MEFWVELLASGNLPNLLIIVAIAIVTGGTGAAIVSGVVASRRGIKGDALVKEQNAINGLGTLTEGQQGFITQITAQLATVEAKAENRIKELKKELEAKNLVLSHRIDSELQYSNSLIVLLAQHGIPAPPRPLVLEIDDE
jgi:hypothetical protein